MRTIEVKLYQFAELSETAKEYALNELYDINVSYDWWDCVYDDAKDIGLEITEFDLCHMEIDGNLLHDLPAVKKAITTQHGRSCDTYKYVQSFDMRTDVDFNDFKYGLLQEYLSMLQKESDYQTSKEAIIKSIECNEYEFDENGNLV